MGNKKSTNNNLVYVLTGTKGLDQLYLSSYSAKKYCKCNIIVVTNQATKKAFGDIKDKRFLSYIDKVMDFYTPSKYNDMQCSRWLKTSLANILDFDFVYIDADTIITKDIFKEYHSFHKSVGFRLDPFRKTSQWDSLYKQCGIDIHNNDANYVCNGGMCFVRNDQYAKTFFSLWHTLWIDFSDKNQKFMDQPTLAQTIKNMFDLERFEVLPEKHNAIMVSEAKNAYILHYLRIRHDNLDASFCIDVNNLENTIEYIKKLVFKPLSKNTFLKKEPIQLEGDFRDKQPEDLRVAIFAIAKNENKYIRDWAEYHIKLGFDSIIINDNNDIEGENFFSVIGDLIKQRKIVILNRRGERILRTVENDKNGTGLQEICMSETYNLFKSQFDWVAIIDIDEYITLSDNHKDIKHFLAQSKFHDADIVKVKWMYMNDNNQLYYENKPVLERFPFGKKMDEAENKSFFRTCITDFEVQNGAHTAINRNIQCCNTKGEYMISNARNQSNLNKFCLTYDDCYIKHFIFKTVEEFAEKRIFNSQVSNKRPRMFSFFNWNSRTDEKERMIQQYITQYNNSLEHPQPAPPITEDNSHIFILGYKDFDCPVHNPKLYSIVDCSADGNITGQYDVPVIKTQKKNSISSMNEIYDEWTGIYWLWKNYDWSNTEYIGLCQYRRYFEFLDKPELAVIGQADVVVGQSRVNYQLNNLTDFRRCHNIDELDSMIRGFAPDDMIYAKEFLLSTSFFPSNLIFLRKKDFFDYCAFVFGYIKKYQYNNNLYSVEDVVNRVKSTLNKYPQRGSAEETLKYQKQMLAFLMERLGNIWIFKQFHDKKKVMKVSCIETQNTGQNIFKYKDIYNNEESNTTERVTAQQSDKGERETLSE